MTDTRQQATATYSGRLSEITSIARIRQGTTAPISITAKPPGPDPTAPPVRWVDNLRLALETVSGYAHAGFWTPLNDVGTIHAARWVILPGDRELMFCATFDGSFEQYIHDFAEIANSGKPTPHNTNGAKWMDMIWGNCIDYPGTDDIDDFLAFIRNSLVETTLWFTTIDDVTVRDISWFRQYRQCVTAFDQVAMGVPRDQWPSELRAAYDGMKRAINQIDVTDV